MRIHINTILANLIFTLMLVCVTCVKSQTSIVPIIGYGLSKTMAFENDAFDLSHVKSDEDFDHGFIFYGLGVTQKLFKNGMIELRYKRSRLNFNYFTRGIVGYTDFRFNRHAISLTPKLLLFQNIEIGLGFDYKRLTHVEVGKKRSDIWNRLDKEWNQEQTGWIASIGYNYKSLNMTLEYINNDGINLDGYSHIDTTNSVELSLNYRIKVFGGNK